MGTPNPTRGGEVPSELTSLQVPSSSASRDGGITMERLGGFLLCRRLLLERLLPFLLLDAILSKK